MVPIEEASMPAKLTWLGHAAFRLELPEHTLIIDPYLSDNPAAAVSPEEIDGDYILISHGHGDHVGDAVEIAKRTGAPVISNFEIVNWFADKGIEGHGQHLGGGHHHPFGHLKLTLALHGSGLPDGSYGGNPAGFLLTTNEGEKIYFACDTGLFSDMALIGEEGIDLAVLPIGDNFTMGPEDALRAVKLIQPTHVIPVHYNTFELIQQDPEAWAERVRSETEATPHVIAPGETFSL
jgi:L-ascorbate metabolism protein UlaG (beta-lactamase superfamily)